MLCLANFLKASNTSNKSKMGFVINVFFLVCCINPRYSASLTFPCSPHFFFFLVHSWYMQTIFTLHDWTSVIFFYYPAIVDEYFVCTFIIIQFFSTYILFLWDHCFVSFFSHLPFLLAANSQKHDSTSQMKVFDFFNKVVCNYRSFYIFLHNECFPKRTAPCL